MAKDYRGVLLIMLAIVRSAKGRAILQAHKNFKQESDIADWILLLELMLEWESYLNQPQMQVYHVKRLERKHRYIMYIMRKVARRQQGMGLKLMKFHTILHIWEDIIQFGVPLEYDTSANERMHKPAKAAAKRTQRAADTFNYQTAMRLIEYELLDLALHEIETGNVPWLMPEWEEEEPEQEQPDPIIRTGEAGVKLFRDDDGEIGFEMRSRSKHSANTRWNSELLSFLGDLSDKVLPYIAPDSVPIFTKHERNGQIFRGHPNFRGKGPWRDWAWIEWGGNYGTLPCHIWCFVVLEGMPTGPNALEHGGIRLTDGTYAVVETAYADEEGEIMGSDLMTPWLKEANIAESGEATGRSFYLADTEAFVAPCCCIPDVGGPKNRYFVVAPRAEWSDLFVQWVEDAHNKDAMDPMEETSSEEATDEAEDGEESDEDSSGEE